jgi:hypothetical protein
VTHAKEHTTALRIIWMSLGGIIGGSIGFGGYRSLPQNADSFGTMLAQGFFLWYAVVGLMAGTALGGLIGSAAYALLRRLGAKPPVALGLATAVTVMLLVQTTSLVLSRYPGLHRPANAAQPTGPSRRVTLATDSSARPRPTQSPCTGAAPTDARELRLWREECR